MVFYKRFYLLYLQKQITVKKFRTNFKLSKNYSSLLSSLNFLKELVAEPSNIIYPTSFAKY